jgi:hypothetical protein
LIYIFELYFHEVEVDCAVFEAEVEGVEEDVIFELDVFGDVLGEVRSDAGFDFDDVLLALNMERVR